MRLSFLAFALLALVCTHVTFEAGARSIDGSKAATSNSSDCPQVVCPLPQLRVSPVDATTGALFGWSVAIDGDFVAVGARGQLDARGIRTGAAYLYSFDGDAVQEQVLTDPDGAFDDAFGWSVSIDGNRAVVGARQDDDLGPESGSAFVYKYSGREWKHETKLLASDGRAFDYFGEAVAISGDTIVVGSPLAGVVYVFRHDGLDWIEEAQLGPDDSGTNDFFGEHVALDGDLLIAGARFHDHGPSTGGAAYLFRCDGSSWVQEAELVGEERGFGIAVDVDGDRAVVGTEDGRAHLYAFREGTWELEMILEPDEPIGLSEFGEAVAVSGDLIVVGARIDDWATGAAHVFRHRGTKWLEHKIVAFDGVAGDYFGISVAADDGGVVIGSLQDDTSVRRSGSAYILRVHAAGGAPR